MARQKITLEVLQQREQEAYAILEAVRAMFDAAKRTRAYHRYEQNFGMAMVKREYMMSLEKDVQKARNAYKRAGKAIKTFAQKQVA